MFLLWLQILLLWRVSSFDISWFKQTSIHDSNVIKLKNGWEDCKEWTGTSGGLSSINEFGKILFFNLPEVPDIMYNFTARCITLEVPLDWDDFTFTNETDIQTINYFISHVYAQNNTDISNDGAFWMLAGGPGSPGTSFYTNAIPWLTYLDGTYDLYLPDHRGTGSSSPLYCPPEIKDAPIDCSAFVNQRYGNDTQFYSTYAASFDLGYAIDLFKNNMTVYSDNNTVVYGLSYGTYYLNQYLQMFPNQSQAVILDGVCPPDICNLVEYDYNSNKVGMQFLEHCENDAFCSNILAEYGTPQEIITDIFDDTKNNADIVPCLQQMDESEVSAALLANFLWYMMALSDYRALIPSLLYRLHRCSSKDMEMLQNIPLYAAAFANPTDTSNSSVALQWNIALSELFDFSNFSEPNTELYFATGIASMVPPWYNIWNKYVPNPLVYKKFADPTTPILILNGDLDPQTPWEWALHSAQQYKANINDDGVRNPLNRYYYLIPTAVHGTIWYSPIVNDSDYTLDTCGMRIIKSFINAENNVPDGSCVNWIKDIDWGGKDNGTQDSSTTIFNGVADMWESINFTTVEPTILPSIMPTFEPPTGADNPTVAPSDKSEDTDKTWFIVAVVFIVLFGVALIVIGVLAYKLNTTDNGGSKKGNDGKGAYGTTNAQEIEAGVYHTR